MLIVPPDWMNNTCGGKKKIKKNRGVSAASPMAAAHLGGS